MSEFNDKLREALDKQKNELKPCPFCGSEAEIREGVYQGEESSYVRCRECKATGRTFIISRKYASNERAIEAWNRRAE